jgi:homocysteine S-methyltransferase
MATYRSALPQLEDDFFMTDGGIETTLIFLEGHEIPEFAAFHLLKTPEGENALRKYFQTYAALARRFDVGLILETASWRSNADWGKKLGYSQDDLATANRKLVGLLEDIRNAYET